MSTSTHRIALITGASQGIGLATAAKFLAKRWQVINLSRHPCPLEGVDNLQMDLSQLDHSAVINALSRYTTEPSVWALIHNASYYTHDTVQDLKQTDLLMSLQVGLIGPSQLNQILLPSMARGSSILYIGSTLSEKAVKNAATYTTTKHAVVGLMRATCQDLDNRGIHTACICPGFTDTKMLRQHIPDAATCQQILKGVTARRLIHPDEIAKTIWFCANNPVVNGSLFHVNLGQLTP